MTPALFSNCPHAPFLLCVLSTQNILEQRHTWHRTAAGTCRGLQLLLRRGSLRCFLLWAVGTWKRLFQFLQLSLRKFVLIFEGSVKKIEPLFGNDSKPPTPSAYVYRQQATHQKTTQKVRQSHSSDNPNPHWS